MTRKDFLLIYFRRCDIFPENSLDENLILVFLRTLQAEVSLSSPPREDVKGLLRPFGVLSVDPPYRFRELSPLVNKQGLRRGERSSVRGKGEKEMTK